MEMTIKYLKFEKGAFYYQRRVPEKAQPAVGKKLWREALGKDPAAATLACVKLAEEHDAFVASVKADPAFAAEAAAELLRRKREEIARYMDPLSDMIARRYNLVDEARERLEARMKAVGMPSAWTEAAVAVPQVLERCAGDDAATLTGLCQIRAMAFPEGGEPASPAVRAAYEGQRNWLDNQIRLFAPDGAGLTLAEAVDQYLAQAQIKDETRRKFGSHLKGLVGFLPGAMLADVSSSDLRRYRDELKKRMKESSVQAHFTAIRSCFRYFVEEEVLEDSPVTKVTMPKISEPVEATKWLPFTPQECSAIYDAIETYWGRPVRGMAEDRREAYYHLAKVMMFSTLRPREVVMLRPEDVTDEAITVREGKTDAAYRVHPLHPELAGFPAWIRAGGMDTFEGVDGAARTSALRGNFAKLLAKRLSPPIKDDRKVLYSFRSTFQNAMRRAGVDETVRRALLGHAEVGALRHYDDGPEFDLKREAVLKTDPRRAKG